MLNRKNDKKCIKDTFSTHGNRKGDNPNNGQIANLWNGKSDKLVSSEYLSKFFPDLPLVIPFIKEGYRHPCNTLLNVVKLSISLNNETLNVLTHFSGFLYFLYLFLENLSAPYAQEDVFFMGVYLLVTIILLFCSSAFHFLSNHLTCRESWHICDWVMVAIMIGATTFMMGYKEFYCYKWWNASCGIVSVIFSVYFSTINGQHIANLYPKTSKCIHGGNVADGGDLKRTEEENLKDKLLTLRILCIIYACLGLIYWMIHYLITAGRDPYLYYTLPGLLTTYAWYTAVLFVVLKLPESIVPASWNYILYSHPLFHVGVVLGAYVQYNASKEFFSLNQNTNICSNPL